VEEKLQTGYWKLKLQGSPVMKNIKVFFVTLDEDGDLVVKKPAKKEGLLQKWIQMEHLL
jgi:type II restriction enzyme